MFLWPGYFNFIDKMFCNEQGQAYGSLTMTRRITGERI